MYRLVIADDERVIRETIASFIDWKSLDIEVVAVCQNGNEAYEAILDEYPDLVLTDIRMPGMSGLELIRRLREAGGQMEFVILSGYGEFEYAKAAMQMGVQNYLLKPCNENQIIEVMQQAKKAFAYNRRIRELTAQQSALKNDVFASRIWAVLQQALSTDEPISEVLKPFSAWMEQSAMPMELVHLPRAEDSMEAAQWQTVADFFCHRNPSTQFCLLETRHALFVLMGDIKNAAVPDWLVGAHTEKFSSLEAALNHLLVSMPRHEQYSVIIHGTRLPLKGLALTPQAEQVMSDVGLSPQNAAAPNRIVNSTLNYMRQHLSEPSLSLKNIAENYLFMNVDYVSRQFVKHTGQRFSACLREMRIEKAKHLFQNDPYIKINEVAEQVGCGNNPQYFNYIFKKQTGLTPGAYQKSLQEYK